ncbi:MAG: hypothetical protein JRC92_04205 [Deltaproteobacteria bacterium]|nr:hypothetical protein [Deltaproteobacteria bacterium]
MPKALFVFLNWAILIAFIGMNVYVTYHIIRSYGIALGSIFKKQESE